MNILNKQRVNIKHFSILPDIEECRYFGNDVKLFFSELSLRFFERDFESISLVDLIDEVNIRKYLKQAENDLENCKYEDCQINCRKALYFVFEDPYDMRYIGDESNLDVLFDFNEEEYKEKIKRKVFNPIDFIETKRGRSIKDELIEMGIEFITYENIMEKLTPKVYFFKEKNKWAVMKDLQYRVEYNRENAYYCLNNSVNIILKRQRCKNKVKWLREEGETKEITGLTVRVYKRASKKSKVEHILEDTLTYNLLIEFKVNSLDDDSYFYLIVGNESSKEFGYLDISGYICEDDLNEELIKKFNS